MGSFASIGALENGLLVTFSRVKVEKRQLTHGVDLEAMVRAGAQGVAAAMRGEAGEDWKGPAEEPERQEPKVIPFYVLVVVSVFCQDDAALAKAVNEARSEYVKAQGLGLVHDVYASSAVPLGIGLSQFMPAR